MEFIPLKDAVEALLSGDRRRQRQIVDEICAGTACACMRQHRSRAVAPRCIAVLLP